MLSCSVSTVCCLRCVLGGTARTVCGMVYVVVGRFDLIPSNL
jgi:hypothetical protein